MKWRNYKHRFVPWVTANWSTRLVKQSEAQPIELKQATVLNQLNTLLTGLHSSIPELSPCLVRKLSKHEHEFLKYKGDEVLKKTFEFCLDIRQSRLPNCGNGVFVTGDVKEGQLVGLYPGTLYLPSDPILFQSINNSYILRCIDGIHIDGKNKGLSKLIYRSCAFRDVIGRFMSCDLTWLTLRPINPLAVGQLVNNATRDIHANVEYTEISTTWPLDLQQFIPNIYYEPHLDSTHTKLYVQRDVCLQSVSELSMGSITYIYMYIHNHICDIIGCTISTPCHHSC